MFAGGRIVAVRSAPASPAAGGATSRWLHHDALGSVDLVTDHRGRVAAHQGFSPFGERRPGIAHPAARSASIESAMLVAAVTPRGFTGHESLEAVGLVHMNGRVYDPALGRFLSADPFVQSPHDGQTHNRYAYARNNPLKYVDPGGHFFKRLMRFVTKHFPTIFQIAVMAVLSVASAGAWIVAVASAAITYATTGGDLRASLRAGVMAWAAAGAAGWIGENVALGFERHLVHGLAQGTLSRLGGGSFRAGFWGAAVGHAVGGKVIGSDFGNSIRLAGRTAVAAVAGGVAAELGGGKFANGAVSAAFSHLFNGETQMRRKLENRKWANPTGGKMRNDDAGKGHFGARRIDEDGNYRSHEGVDIKGKAGETTTKVLAPISGRLERGYPYKEGYGGFNAGAGTKINGESFFYETARLVAGDGVVVEVFYVKLDSNQVGEYVEAGDPIGQMQAVSTRYPNEGMTDHVHVEAKVDGVLMDPTKLLPGL